MRARTLTLWMVALALGACQAAPPVAENKPKRRSFEDSGAAASNASDRGASGYDTTQAKADEAQDRWDAAKAAGTDTEREREANAALDATQQAADAPSGQ